LFVLPLHTVVHKVRVVFTSAWHARTINLYACDLT
jgi:hypothetical protein